MNKIYRTFAIMLLICSPTLVCAQLVVEKLINDYVETINQKKDVTSCLSRLNLVYKEKNPEEQKVFRNNIYEAISKKQEEGKNRESLALIDLYQFFAEPKDENLPLLYYIKGDISITEFDDSVTLKNAIKDLQMCDTKQNPQIAEYIHTLQGYLEDFRNYVPVMNRIDGVWIPINTIYKYKDGKVPFMSVSSLYAGYFQPCYIIQKEKDSMSLRMLGAYGECLRADDGAGWIVRTGRERMLSQHVVEQRRNKIYVDWSSETLKEPNKEMLSAMLDLSTSVGDMFATSLLGDVSNTLTDFTSNVFSSGLSSLVSSAFAPSKVITIVQCELELINDYEMRVVFNNQIIKIKGDGSPDIYRTTEEVLFTKWEKHDENYLIIGYTYYPNEYFNDKNEKKIKKLDSYKHYHKLIKSVRHVSANGIEYAKAWVTFNNIQALKQLYRNEQRMRNEGLPLSARYNSDRNHTTLGCSYDIAASRPEAGYAKKGVYIEKVEDYSTAYLHGIRRGDVLLNIDGYEMNTPKQTESYIMSQEPFTIVNLEILRNGTTLKIPVELSYKVVTN